MKKYILALALSFAFVGVASAATLYETEFKVDGEHTTVTRAGRNVDVEFKLDLESGEDLEYARFIVRRDGYDYQSTCKKITPRRVGLKIGEAVKTSFRLANDLPDALYDLKVKIYGNGMESAIEACDPDEFMTGELYDGRIEIDHDSDVSNADTTTGGNGSGVGGGEDTDMSKLMMTLTQLIALLSGQINNPPVSTTPCPPLYQSNNRVEVQSWLMNNGYAGGFNAVGIYTVDQLYGSNIIWGSVSQAAYSAAQVACK